MCKVEMKNVWHTVNDIFNVLKVTYIWSVWHEISSAIDHFIFAWTQWMFNKMDLCYMHIAKESMAKEKAGREGWTDSGWLPECVS